MIQETLILKDFKIPILIVDNVNWYPIQYIMKNILLRDQHFSGSEKYKDYITKLNIDYDAFKGIGGIQNTNCINHMGFMKWIGNLNKGTMNENQKNNLNILLDYLGLDVINSDLSYKNIKDVNVENYNEFIKDKINQEGDIETKLCTKCGNHYPMSVTFFYKDDRKSDGYASHCKQCIGCTFANKSDYLEKIYIKYGEKMYEKIKRSKIENIYLYYFKKEIDIKPKASIREDQEKIVVKLFKNGYLNKENLTVEYLETIFQNTSLKFSIQEIYDLLYPDWRVKLWKYPNAKFKNMTKEDAVIIVKNYIEENKVVIGDVYGYEYGKLFSKCRIKNVTNSDLLGFVMYYYNNEFISYKFSISSTNYYKIKENRAMAIKDYIEKELKIDVNRIPLYVTRNKVHTASNTLYNILIKYYDNSMFRWIEEAYPSLFVESDFKMECIRTSFDSLEEQTIDDEFRKLLKYQVVHNVSSDRNTVRVFGKQPDWFIFTDQGVWIVEYWGMYSERLNSKMTIMYMDKYKMKKEIYESNTDYYNYLFIYPYDLKNNLQGLHEKINRVIKGEEKMVS